MDNWRKITYGIGRSVALGAGLLGWYLAHKNRIPEFMGLVSSGVACASLYAWTTYFFEKTGDENKENKSCAAAEHLKDDLNLATDEKASTETPKAVNTDENKSCTAAENLKDDLSLETDEKASTETLKSVEQDEIARRNFISQFMEETDKILEYISKVERLNSSETCPKNSERIFSNISDFPHVNENVPDDTFELLKTISDIFGENNLAEVEEAGISIPTSPLKLKMLDIEIKNSEIKNTEDTLTENTKDIIYELQVGEIHPSIDSDKKK